MATCSWCEQDMVLAVPCTVAVEDIGPRSYPRIRYGDNLEGWEDLGFEPPSNCHDCATPIGGFHHVNCDVECCGKCHGQALSCECTDDDEGYCFDPAVLQAQARGETTE